MNMVASLVAMMGPAQSATQVAAEGKSADTGKSFAESLDERIAEDADVTAKMGAATSAPQTKDGAQTWKSGAVQENSCELVTAAKARQASGERSETPSMPLIQEQIVIRRPDGHSVTAVAATNTSTVDAPASAAMQAPGVGAADTELISAATADDAKDADVKRLGVASIGDPKVNAGGGSDKPQSVKTLPSGGIPRAAQVDVSAASLSLAADAQSNHALQEFVPAGSGGNGTKSSERKTAATKATAKREAADKAEPSLKAADAGASAGIVFGTTSTVVGTAVVSSPAGSCSAMDSGVQMIVPTPSKQGSAAVVMTRGQAAALTLGDHPSAAKSSAQEKQGDAGVEAVNKPVMDAHVAQKDEQVPAKSGDAAVVAAAPQTAIQTGKLAEKSQAFDASAVVLHTAGVDRAAVNTSGASAGLHVPVSAAPKYPSGNVPATLPASHGGSGEMSGTIGAQTAALSETHRTLVATPTVLEVGIPNGSQGWLKVRAELTGGGVSASLSAASPAGQEMLHRELPALTTYLQQEKVAVSSLVVQTPATGGFRGLSGGTGGYSGAQPQQHDQGNGGRHSLLQAGSVTHSAANVQVPEEQPGAVHYPIGGGWLSVRA